MEARITETVPLRSASKAQLTAEKKQTSPDSFSNIKARHRRSMSDPYLQKTFSEVKKLWDTKVETGTFLPVASRVEHLKFFNTTCDKGSYWLTCSKKLTTQRKWCLSAKIVCCRLRHQLWDLCTRKLGHNCTVNINRSFQLCLCEVKDAWFVFPQLSSPRVFQARSYWTVKQM